MRKQHALLRTAAALGAAVTLASGLLLGIGVSAASATTPGTVYVAQTGTDAGNNCSVRTNPCATVTNALTQASKVATAAVVDDLGGTIMDNVVMPNSLSSVTITGATASASDPPVIDGADGKPGLPTGDVIQGSGNSNLTVLDLTVENAAGVANDIDNRGTGTFTVTDSTLAGSGASGIDNDGGGNLNVSDSTISGNAEDGIVLDVGGVAQISASTLVGNGWWGIANRIGPTDLPVVGASLLASNAKGDCENTSVSSAGYNLSTDSTCGFPTSDVIANLRLGSLKYNHHGRTKTYQPLAASPAIDEIPPTVNPLDGFTVCPGTDQDGLARPAYGQSNCTIGAVEGDANIPTSVVVTAMPSTVVAGHKVVYIASVNSTIGTATGSVAFSIGSTVLCTAQLTGGAGACGSTKAPAGTDTVTGRYAGAAKYEPSSGTTTLTVTAT